MPTERRYYVWSPRGEVYHDGAVYMFFQSPVPDCDTGRAFAYFRNHQWKSDTKPPRGRRLCKRCEKLRKGAK